MVRLETGLSEFCFGTGLTLIQEPRIGTVRSETFGPGLGRLVESIVILVWVNFGLICPLMGQFRSFRVCLGHFPNKMNLLELESVSLDFDRFTFCLSFSENFDIVVFFSLVDAETTSDW